MAGADAIGVLIAERHRLVRVGFRLVLEREGTIVVVGEASRGEDAVAIARELHPDVVVMDAGLPGMDAFRAARQIFEGELARAGVVLLTTSTDDRELLAALRAGARGVLRRDSEPGDLRRAVHVVAHGGVVLASGSPRRVATNVLRRRTDAADAYRRLHVLTDREREVVALVGLGFGNAQIAERLMVSPATIKAHVSNSMAKLDVRDRAQLVMLAYETGLLEPASDASLGGTGETRL